MDRTLRKLNLTAHVASSVGWFGAVVAYVALAITVAQTDDASLIRAAFVSMERVGWTVIVPLAMGALLTGLVHSLGTEWGLFRHYWVAAKFVLTVIGVAVLLMHMPTISRIAEAAALGPVDFARLGAPRLQPLVHAVGGALLLLVTLVLSIYKPWGKTRLGRDRAGQMPAPELFRALLIGAAIVAALVAFIVAHVLGWTPRH